jgi:hypothetical protein
MTISALPKQFRKGAGALGCRSSGAETFIPRNRSLHILRFCHMLRSGKPAATGLLTLAVAVTDCYQAINSAISDLNGYWQVTCLTRPISWSSLPLLGRGIERNVGQRNYVMKVEKKTGSQEMDNLEKQ